MVEYLNSDSEAGYRELILGNEIIGIFKKIKKDSKMFSEYIFVKEDGSRAEKMVFIHWLEKAELALGWDIQQQLQH